MKLLRRLKAYVPVPAAVFFGMLALGCVVGAAARSSVAFADFWNDSVARVPRAVLSYLTAPLPFSLAEYMLLCVPLAFVLLVVYAVKKTSLTWRATIRYILTLLSVAALVFAMLLINFTPGYYTTTIDQKIGISRLSVSAQELRDTAELLLKNVNELSEQVDYIYASSSVLPYSVGELSDSLRKTYGEAGEKYDFLQRLNVGVKEVMLSEPWTYTHIAGVYTFFTGEANINTNYPDYTLPYTIAHEMAHQRGIAREEEANFVAFLMCLESDDPYVRYSAYLSVYEYVASALYSADAEMYYEVLGQMNREVRHELIAFYDFFEKYEDNPVASVTQTINDTYLKNQGQTDGVKSYGLVVDLAVAYYKK